MSRNNSYQKEELLQGRGNGQEQAKEQSKSSVESDTAMTNQIESKAKLAHPQNLSNSVIDEISKRSRAQIFERLEQGYHDPKVERVETVDPIAHVKMSDDLIENLKENMIANRFEVHDVASEDMVYETINSITKSLDAKTLVYPANLGLDLDKVEAQDKLCFNERIENIRDKVFNSDFSIINAHLGVSSHGVVCVTSTKEQPRMLSLVTPLCIVLLKKEKVVKSLVDALHQVKAEHEILPTNILFIAGPSRTADVELVTVFGVHGSTHVHVILY